MVPPQLVYCFTSTDKCVLMIQYIWHPLSHVALDDWGLGRFEVWDVSYLGLLYLECFEAWVVLLVGPKVFGMFCSWDVWCWGPWDVLSWDVLSWDVCRCIDILSIYYLYVCWRHGLTVPWAGFCVTFCGDDLSYLPFFLESLHTFWYLYWIICVVKPNIIHSLYSNYYYVEKWSNLISFLVQ